MTFKRDVVSAWEWITWWVFCFWINLLEPFLRTVMRVRRDQIKPAHHGRKLRNYYHEYVSCEGPFKRAWLWHVRRHFV